MVIFDDVVVPWDRVFIDGDTVGYDEVISAHELARADRQPGDDARLDEARADVRPRARDHGCSRASTRFDHVQEKLGEIWSYVEMTRSGVIASEAGSYGAEPSDAWTPDERPLVALRGLMPKWIPRAFELLAPGRRGAAS